MQAVEGQSKKSQATVFTVMVLVFLGSAWWQITENRRPASDEEVQELEEEGDCEGRYVKKWATSEESKRLTRSDLAHVRAICLREAEMAEKLEQLQKR